MRPSQLVIAVLSFCCLVAVGIVVVQPGLTSDDASTKLETTDAETTDQAATDLAATDQLASDRTETNQQSSAQTSSGYAQEADTTAQLTFDAADLAGQTTPEPEPEPEPIVRETTSPDPEPEPEPIVRETTSPDPEPEPEPIVSPFEEGLGLEPEPAPEPIEVDETGTALAEESFIATVTTEGVPSYPEPTQGEATSYFKNPTQFGGDRTFLVLDQTSSPDFVKVSLPIMPNGQVGWIPRDAVEITAVNHRALVDLTDDSIKVWAGDSLLVDTKAVTGKPSTPTPVGVFYVRDVIATDNPGGGYGPYILALSGFSEVLETFQGGLPAIAIHGTSNPGLIGGAHSNGCVRIPNDLITLLAETVPLGTPVTIVA